MLHLLADATSQAVPPTMEYLAGAGLGVFVVKTFLDSPFFAKRRNGAERMATCMEHSGLVATLRSVQDQLNALTHWTEKISGQLDEALRDKKP